MAQQGFCTKTQLGYAVNAERLIALCDDDRDGVADVGVQDAAIMTASYVMQGGINDRYKEPGMDPDGYEAGAYPILDNLCPHLTVQVLLNRNPREATMDLNDHWVMKKIKEAHAGNFDIVAAT